MPDSSLSSTVSSEFIKTQSLPHRRYSRRTRRIISKSGEININLRNLPQKSTRFFRDLVTTIIDARWQVVILAYLTATFGCWTMFALLWYLISYSHNDLAIDTETGASLHEGEMTCVEGAETFTGFFLLSFELQSTVGFGERYPNEECPEAIFMMIAQVVVGIALDGTMIAIIYAKLTRPPQKPNHLKFSRKAVICRRDSKLCLMFRICDPNEMLVIDSNVQACLIGDINSIKGKSLNRFQHILKLQDGGRVLVLFPLIVCHVIDDESSLYTLSAKHFLEKRFEIIVTFTGTSASTGLTTQQRTSYLSKEILWGHRFVNMMEHNFESGKYFIDYDLFDVTEEIETPLCSAQQLDELRKIIENQQCK